MRENKAQRDGDTFLKKRRKDTESEVDGERERDNEERKEDMKTHTPPFTFRLNRLWEITRE